MSRRRTTSQQHEANRCKEDVNGEADSNDCATRTPEKRKKGSGALSLGKLRLRCLALLTPASTAAERRRRRAALGKATAVVLYSAALLIVGSIAGGGGKGLGEVLLGLVSFGLIPHGATRSKNKKPSSVAFFDGASGYDTTYSSGGLLTDRDARLDVLDRAAFGTSYGGLRIRRLAPGEEGRVVGPPDPRDAESDAPLPLHPKTPTEDPYDPYDDDGVRSAVFRLRNRETRKCKRAPWHKYHRPTCNDFHSVDLFGGIKGDDIRYVGRGHFRQAFAIKGRNADPDTSLKVLRWRDGVDDYVDRIEKTRMDALVMERLTSSPRITNVHGHCATSISVESLPGEIWEVVVPTDRIVMKKDLNDKFDVDNKNGMTPTEKLQLALDISEALAELHGFKDGVIVHDDIDLGQFLRTPEGKVKLNDFNRAKPMLWDSVEQKYCKYYNGHIGGKMRSPEEFTEPPGILNEKMDVYSMGNNFWGILSGLYPFYHVEDQVAQKKMVQGARTKIDERWRKHSFAEGKLVEVIRRCWIHNPDQRTDIFWVVKFLREAVAENAKLHAANAQAR